MLGLFHFLRPWWLSTIIIAIILFILLLSKLHSSTNNNWAKYCDAHLLPHVLSDGNQAKNFHLPLFLLILWIISAFALAGPTWSLSKQPTYQKDTARIIALDLSSSMTATDIKPSRQQRAIYKVLDVLHNIKEGQTGMLVFSSYPFVVSPLTSDSNTIASLVPALTTNILPVQGVDIARALNKSAKLLKQGGYNHGQIILITDSTPSADDIATAKDLANQGYITSVWGIGTTQGGPIMQGDGSYATDSQGNIILAQLDKQKLEQLTRDTSGSYIDFTNTNLDLDQIINLINNKINFNNVTKTHKTTTKNLWEDKGIWLIWLLLCLAPFIGIRGWLEKIC